MTSKELKKRNRRKTFVCHRNRHPKDNKGYKAYKKMRDESISKMQEDNDKRLKEEAKFGNKVKKLFAKFVPKIKPRLNSQRGK